MTREEKRERKEPRGSGFSRNGSNGRSWLKENKEKEKEKEKENKGGTRQETQGQEEDKDKDKDKDKEVPTRSSSSLLPSIPTNQP